MAMMLQMKKETRSEVHSPAIASVYMESFQPNF